MGDYSIPTMQEISGIEPNGFRVASLFAGGGGSSLGYRMAGFSVVYANEFVDIARETYEANASPKTVTDGRDIREVTPESLLSQIGLTSGQLDILDGSPPCAAFSTAGKLDKGWGKEVPYSGKVQRVDDLFDEYIRMVRGVQPKVFVAENVPGLVQGKAIGYFKRVFSELKKSGYQVSARVLDAQWLGVPQSRRRLIFVGVRDDLGLAPLHPKPQPKRIPLSSALRLAEEFGGYGSEITTDPETGGNLDIRDMSLWKYAKRLEPGEISLVRFSLVRPSADLPIPTVTTLAGDASSASVIHPNGYRKLTLRELRAVSGFPLDFELLGTHSQKHERIGRSVPPLMMRSIATLIRDDILREVE